MKILRKKILGIFLSVCISFCVFSCAQKKLSKEKLIDYISSSKELTQESLVNGIKSKLSFYPYQFLVLQELENEKKSDSLRIIELDKKYQGQYYFKLSFSKDNKEAIRQLGDFQFYSDMVHVLSFELGKYINASAENNDTVPLADFVFEQDFGMGASNDILLVFKKEDFKNSGNINVNIGELGFGVGNMKFIFRKKDIDNIPLLAGYEPVE